VNGLHLTADLRRCRCEPDWLTNADRLLEACVERVRASGLQAVARLAHSFPPTPAGPGGVTATVLLAESHVCVHTWPESRSVSLDVYVCNFGADHSARAEGLMHSLLALFEAEEVERRSLQRGAAPVGS
jgi:S-adenosylmethionine decarboxylase